MPEETKKQIDTDAILACARCRFWQRGLAERGHCRRHTPTIHADGESGAWPVTFGGHWCGEFELRVQGGEL